MSYVSAPGCAQFFGNFSENASYEAPFVRSQTGTRFDIPIEKYT